MTNQQKSLRDWLYLILIALSILGGAYNAFRQADMKRMDISIEANAKAVAVEREDRLKFDDEERAARIRNDALMLDEIKEVSKNLNEHRVAVERGHVNAH